MASWHAGLSTYKAFLTWPAGRAAPLLLHGMPIIEPYIPTYEVPTVHRR